MAEGLEELCQKLSLTEDEQGVVVLDSTDSVDLGFAPSKGLICKALSGRKINVEAMRSVLYKIWRLNSALQVQEVGDHLYHFQFLDVDERNRVLGSQPWTFDKTLFIFKQIDPILPPESMEFTECPFWIQVEGLPLGLRTARVGEILGQSLGILEDVDVHSRNLRLRVLLNLSQPLKRVTKMKLPNGGDVLVLFRYEHLEDFCFG